jgi:DNA-binding XRE family transcriptional regulator
MKKNPEVKKRIKKLMAELGMKSQAQFAEKLDLPQTTVSAWRTGDNTPSAKTCLDLGSMAHDPEDLMFWWGLAGLTPGAVRSAAKKIVGGQIVQPVEGSMMRLSPLPGGPWEQTGEFEYPAALLPNPDSTYFLRMPETGSEQFSFTVGDILVLDTRDAASLYVKPFFGHVVAVGGASHEEWPLVGRLWFWKTGRCFEANLTPVGGLATPRTNLIIADYEISPSMAEDKASDEAFEKMRQSPKLPILGRLVAYLPGEPEARIL